MVWRHQAVSWRLHFTALRRRRRHSYIITLASRRLAYIRRVIISLTLSSSSSTLTSRRWRTRRVTATRSPARPPTGCSSTPSASSAATKVPVNTTACWRARDARVSLSGPCVATWLTRVAVAATALSTSIIATSVNIVDSRNVSKSACGEKVSSPPPLGIILWFCQSVTWFRHDVNKHLLSRDINCVSKNTWLHLRR